MLIKRLQQISLLKNASIYTGANILSALVPFFCMPVLTRYLEPADYGIVAVMEAILAFMTPFVGINLGGAIATQYYRKDFIFSVVVKNSFAILIISTILVAFFLFLFCDFLEKYTHFPKDWLIAVIFICFGRYLFAVVLTILRVQQRARIYGLLQLISVVFNVGISLFLIISLQMNWQGRVLGNVLTVLVCILYSIYFFYKERLLGVNIEIKCVKNMLRFGLPLIPHAISGCVLTMVNRFYIANFVDLDTAGIFTLGTQIGMAIELLAGSFNQAYSPWLYSKLKNINMNTKYKLVRYSYYYFIGIIIIATCYSCIMPAFLNIFLGERFRDVGIYVFPIAMAGAFHGMYYMVVNYIFFTNQTRALMYRTFSLSVSSAILSYYMTSNFGAIGAAYATMISHFLIFLVVWYLSNKVFPLPWGSSYKNI